MRVCRSAQVDAGGAPVRRLECAFARRFCARRIFARSVRVQPTRAYRQLTPGPAGETSLHLFHSSLPHRETETYRAVSTNSRNSCQKKRKLRDNQAKSALKRVPFWPSRRARGAWAPESRAASAPAPARDPAPGAPPATAPAQDRGAARGSWRGPGSSLSASCRGSYPQSSMPHPPRRLRAAAPYRLPSRRRRPAGPCPARPPRTPRASARSRARRR